MPVEREASQIKHNVPSHGRRANQLAALLFLLFSVWMISPILSSSYVEAYMARLQSLALLSQHGQIALDDQAYPINTEFLYVTRLGMVWLLRGAMELFHSTSLWVLRLANTASFILLIASCVVFARRWLAIPAWAVLVCLILTPGILEPAFFFADNLVAASLTSLALALVLPNMERGAGRPRWSGIGVVLACAMLVRVDAVLILPALLALLWLACRDLRKMAAALACAACGAAAIFAISYKVTGVSLLQAFHVGRFFSGVNNNPEIYQTGLRKTMELLFFGFFGLVSLPLLALGIWQNFKAHGRRWTIVMFLCPMLLYLAVLPRANEIRDFCIMGSPFVLLHAATGLRRLLTMVRQPPGPQKSFALVLVAAFALVFVMPPYLSMRDGPRALTGRLYSPIFWRQWQARTLSMIDQIQQLVAAIQPGQSILVINSQFEPDRYLHLRLIQQGYKLESAASQPETCKFIETFQRDGRTVVSIRTDNPYGLAGGLSNGDYPESLQIHLSLTCLQARHFDRAYFFSIGHSGQQYLPPLGGPEIQLGAWFPTPLLHRASYGFFGSVPLSPADLQQLDREAQRSILGTPNPLSAADFHRLVQPRFWTPSP